MKAIVFLDTETTGLHHNRRAWEVSMIRRTNSNPQDDTITIFIDLNDLDLAHADPHGLAIGHFNQRHPAFGHPLAPGQRYMSERAATEIIDEWTAGAEIFGIRPRFDTTTLERAFHRHNRTPQWWRDPTDITDLARGWVLAHGQTPRHNPEKLSRQCGLPIPEPHLRHTAYGDAEWVQRWYDLMHSDNQHPETLSA